MSQPDDQIEAHEYTVMERWLGAVALAATLHMTWMVFYGWYLRLAERGFLFACSDPYNPGGGWLDYSSPCPPDRPYVEIVK